MSKRLPKNTQLKTTARLVRQEYWKTELQPKLKEAERHRANSRFDRAKRMVQEVNELSGNAGLDTAPSRNLLVSIEQSQRATVARGHQNRERARMNETIPVRITGGYNPIGYTENMTRREFVRRKNLKKQGQTYQNPSRVNRPVNVESRPASVENYPKAKSYPTAGNQYRSY